MSSVSPLSSPIKPKTAKAATAKPTKSLILGSSSPRRLAILADLNLSLKHSLKQMTPPYKEEKISFSDNPTAYVLKLAEGKAASLLPQLSSQTGQILIAADTIVCKEGKIFHKPQNSKEATEHLLALAGSWHSVFTAIAVTQGQQIFSAYEETRVLFNPLSLEQIQTYHRLINPFDKAGAYQIQGAGSLIVQQIDGCFYNVLGLPVNTLNCLLKKCGYDLWQNLQSQKTQGVDIAPL